MDDRTPSHFIALSEPGPVAEVGTPGDVVVTNPAGTDPAP
jgi:hypothetical protein